MSGGGAKRGANGEIYGSWDYNEMLIPSGGGANIPVWLHKSMELKTNIPNIAQRYVGSYSAGVGLGTAINSLSSPEEDIISKHITVKRYEIYLNNRTIDSMDVTRRFIGTNDEVNVKIDSTINNSRAQRRTATNWFSN